MSKETLNKPLIDNPLTLPPITPVDQKKRETVTSTDSSTSPSTITSLPSITGSPVSTTTHTSTEVCDSDMEADRPDQKNLFIEVTIHPTTLQSAHLLSAFKNMFALSYSKTSLHIIHNFFYKSTCADLVC